MAQLVVRRTADGLGHAAARLLLARGPSPRGIYATARFCSNDKPSGGATPTGGAPPTGGSPPIGGAPPTGGSLSTGGALHTGGGSPHTGGSLPTGGSPGGRCPTCGGSPGGRCPTCGFPTAGGSPQSGENDLTDFQKRQFKLTAQAYYLHQQEIRQNAVNAEQAARAAILKQKEEEAREMQVFMDKVMADQTAREAVLAKKEVEAKVSQDAVDKVKAEQAALAALVWQKELEATELLAQAKLKQDTMDQERAALDAERARAAVGAKVKESRAGDNVPPTESKWQRFRRILRLFKITPTQFALSTIAVLLVRDAWEEWRGSKNGASEGTRVKRPGDGWSMPKDVSRIDFAIAVVVILMKDQLKEPSSILNRAIYLAKILDAKVYDEAAGSTEDGGIGNVRKGTLVLCILLVCLGDQLLKILNLLDRAKELIDQAKAEAGDGGNPDGGNVGEQAAKDPKAGTSGK